MSDWDSPPLTYLYAHADHRVSGYGSITTVWNSKEDMKEGERKKKEKRKRGFGFQAPEKNG